MGEAFIYKALSEYGLGGLRIMLVATVSREFVILE